MKCQRRHRKHFECQQARMKKDEQAVHDIQICMTEFDAEPFDSSSSTQSMQYGIIASAEFVHDLRTSLSYMVKIVLINFWQIVYSTKSVH